MADEKRTDLLGKLAELSEEAIQRLQDAPGGDRVVGTMSAMKDRLDELQRRVRGVDELETRLSALERKVVPADTSLAQRLAVPAGTEVERIVRLRTADEEPLVLETAHLPTEGYSISLNGLGASREAVLGEGDVVTLIPKVVGGAGL